MKKARLSGVAHTGAKGQKVSARIVQPKDCSKCRRRCSLVVTEDERVMINTEYWALDTMQKKNQFIANWVEQISKKECTTGVVESKREYSRLYFLPVGGNRVAVCKGFFLKTLCIGENKVGVVLKNLPDSKCAIGDRRGNHPGRRKPEIDRDIVREHINSFPRVPSHYCRANSTCEYLAPDLTVIIMYSLYKEYCIEHDCVPVKLWMYREIFNTEFNLKFHAPRKDQCDQCFQNSHSTKEQQEELHAGYEGHLKRKRDAQEFHDQAKKSCREGSINFLQMDFASVRFCPSVEAKAIFYKHRLSVYNFTIFDLRTNWAGCYMWHEGVAGRGSTETGSCLYKCLQKYADGKPLVIMSDTCGGQNRNANVASMLLHCVKSLDIPMIDQCFYEPGHSFMECDSVHARIEKATKKLEVFDPAGWYAGVRMSSNKYKVIEMSQEDFVDVKKLKTDMLKNVKIDTGFEGVNWLKISWLRYRKDDDQHIYFKYEKTEPFRQFKIVRSIRKKSALATLEQVYTSPIALSNNKKVDLRNLCDKGIIPEQYHPFYNSIC